MLISELDTCYCLYLIYGWVLTELFEAANTLSLKVLPYLRACVDSKKNSPMLEVFPLKLLALTLPKYNRWVGISV